MPKIGIIILAAGASKRFGEPKQLAEFQGKTLIENAIENALATDLQNICVVLGANAEMIKSQIEKFPVEILENKNWLDGMSSSLAVGIKFFEKDNFDAVLVMLCDQPLIKSSDLNLLIEKYKSTKKPIVVSKYRQTKGVPAIFSKQIFPQLLQIDGDKGARKVIEENEDLLEIVEIPEAVFDIDTQTDLQKISRS